MHHDFFRNTALAKGIKKFDYFRYAVNKALTLSEKEEAVVIGILQGIQKEVLSNTEQFGQDIILAMLEFFFYFCNRFYHR